MFQEKRGREGGKKEAGAEGKEEEKERQLASQPVIFFIRNIQNNSKIKQNIHNISAAIKQTPESPHKHNFKYV